LSSFRRKPESSKFNYFWMQDRVRHDGFGTFYETIKAIMFVNYPNIIQALIAETESDRLRCLDLSSFVTSLPLKEVYEKIDSSMTFFSVYIAMEHLKDDLWEDSRYVD